ncbi:MAG: GDP-mannose 4,6-dehydratase [Porticoccaceae bacterium]
MLKQKKQVEEIITDVVASDSEWNAIILRYFNPVGAHSSGLIGENPKGVPNNLVPYIAKVAEGSLPYLNIYGGDYPTKDGTGVRDYIHVVDLAMGHVSAVEHLTEEMEKVAIFNLGTGRGASVIEMIKAYEQACGLTVRYKVVERRPGDVAECFAGVDKAKSMLGWAANRSIDEMCQSSWTFQKNLKSNKYK